jgi:Leucine-rich repeat (LRR) protein
MMARFTIRDFCRVRFGLRGLFGLFALLGCLCAFLVSWWQSAARQHAVALFLENIAFVAYDNEYTGGENPPQIVHERGEWSNDLFHSIVNVSFNSSINDADLKKLELLQHLRFLHLGVQTGEGVTDDGMASIDKLRSLRFLQLASAVTDEGLAKLSDLSELQSLNLAACNRITGSGLADLTCDRALRYLALGQRIEDRYLKNVQRFSGLEKLWIGGTTEPPIVTDSGIGSLSGHPSLKSLVLACTPVTNEVASTLSSLPKLETLWIVGSRITGAFSLTGCPNLKRLILTGNAEVGDQILNGIESLTNLEVLSLSHTSVTGATFKTLENLPHLRVLSLQFCPISDAMVDRIAELPELKYLDLYKTQISDAGKDRLQSLRPDLQFGTPDEAYEF